MKIRFFLALWAGKLSIPALKLTHHNGTNFPGELALRLCPDFLRYIEKPESIVTVTGTNGKTTVSNLLNDVFEADGRRVLNNRAGSNINSGIATALLKGVNIFNKSRYQWAILEVDERSSKRIYPYVKPRLTIVTNLFRDSIMRNAHPGYIADFLTASIPETTKLLLNADDLISCGVAPGNSRAYFGIEEMDTDVSKCVNIINDMRICPRCSGRLEYRYLRYHHIGKAYCSDCGFTSPEYDYAGYNVDKKSGTITIRDEEGEGTYKLLSDSVFNIYNLVTAVAALRELGYSHGKLASLMKNISIAKTRYLDERAGNVNVIMQMAKEKNALACSRAIEYVAGQPGEKEIFLMMNCFGDEKHWSENTCWMYDCDFEFMKNDSIFHIMATGPRAKDYRLRLLLAGVPDDRIECCRDELEAAERLEYRRGSKIYVFYGTDGLELAFRVRDRIIELAKEKA